MKTQILMPETQWFPCAAAPAPAWTLARRQAQRLAAASQPRWLRVLDGEVWLTRTTEGDGTAGADHWLHGGERLLLPPGAEFVIEGWLDSRFELLLAAPAPRRPAAWGPALLRRVRAALRPRGLPVGLAG